MARIRILGWDKVAFEIEAQDLETRVGPEGVVEEVKKVPPMGPPRTPSRGGGDGPHTPEEVFFADLRINQPFLFEGKMWKKIGPTKARERSGGIGRPKERPFKPDDIVYLI
jgi:hypothetical protein